VAKTEQSGCNAWYLVWAANDLFWWVLFYDPAIVVKPSTCKALYSSRMLVMVS
jgi:hypothetical protein